MNREELSEKILKSYEGFFDINVPSEEGRSLGLIARCDFHMKNSKYVLVKKAKLWEADCHEYIFVFSVDELNEEGFDRCREYVLKEGEKLIDPKPGHMYTYLTAVFVCDDFTKGAKKLLKKSKHYKSYKFSLLGWSEFRTFAVRAGDGELFFNRAAKQCSKFVKELGK
ncbi:MAG: hypothetical protein LUC92_08350 [Clostridiales bacterium]|nr:hypothetical protein [Clostridiales bacterium]